MSRAFLKLHYDLLESPAYRAFMATPANITYTLLLSHVYRPTRDTERRHPLHGFWTAGWLVAHVSLSEILRQYPERGLRTIQRDVNRLEEMGLLEAYREGQRTPLLVLGRTGTAAGFRGQEQRWEMLYVDKVFGGIDLPQADPAPVRGPAWTPEELALLQAGKLLDGRDAAEASGSITA